MKSCSRLTLQKIGWMTLLLVTGTVNIVGIKFMDVQTVTSPDGTSRKFNHPFLQTWSSYFGGAGILIGYLLYKAVLRIKRGGDPLPDPKPEDKISVWLFLPPGILDLVSTGLIFVALILTHPSSCMMLRGVVIIFTAFLSRFFLGRKISVHKLVGILIILLGLGLVGLTDLIWADPERKTHGDVITTIERDDAASRRHSSSEVLLGDFLVVFSQILVAIQYVYEEKYISKNR
jgi:drug/metabolite transporter (DMT)-like permease